VFGLARNTRLVEELAIAVSWAEEEATRTGMLARRFRDFRWSTLDSWSRRRRVIGKAEWTRGEANPRFIVTSLKHGEIKARCLYERVYCARGEMENRIKECQLDLFAGRISAATMPASQLRLWFASMAYVLLCALRRIGLAHTRSPRPPPARCASRCSGPAPRSEGPSGASRSPWPRPIRTRTNSRSPTHDWPPPRHPDKPDTASRHSPPANNAASPAQRQPRMANAQPSFSSARHHARTTANVSRSRPRSSRW
jgi:hypothetical protein